MGLRNRPFPKREAPGSEPGRPHRFFFRGDRGSSCNRGRHIRRFLAGPCKNHISPRGWDTPCKGWGTPFIECVFQPTHSHWKKRHFPNGGAGAGYLVVTVRALRAKSANSNPILRRCGIVSIRVRVSENVAVARTNHDFSHVSKSPETEVYSGWLLEPTCYLGAGDLPTGWPHRKSFGVLILDQRALKRDPEASDIRVKTAVGMTEVCVSVCAEGIRMLNSRIDEHELLENLRSRLVSRKRH